jgi:tRNA(Ile)-lysidine synthase
MLALDTSLLKPGMRIAVGLSGGADSVALLRALAAQGRELGLVLHVAHLHHGLRGEEADTDLAFCRDLAATLGLPFHQAHVDVATEARTTSETLEEAARRLRYVWFRQLLSKSSPHAVALDAVATAHTLDDQAETVLAKFLRGAWTEGLSGIHPKLESPEGKILRPLLNTSRAEIETYLQALNQPWREDSSNRRLTFTRNRIRHELLPLLETWNPRLREHLTQMAELARDEDAWWAAEISRLAPQFILPGTPVRGGGRAASGGLALDLVKLAAQPAALQRRLIRHAAAQFGVSIDFPSTETLRTLALTGRAGQKSELAGGLRAERSHRELRLTLGPSSQPSSGHTPVMYEIPIPGEIFAPAFGVHLRIDAPVPAAESFPPTAVLRSWKPGDRIRLRHSASPRKVKEVLERLKVTGEARSHWPVLELHGRILWMRGVEAEPEPGLHIVAAQLDPAADNPAPAAGPHPLPSRGARR